MAAGDGESEASETHVARSLLRASADALLDPHVLLEAQRDSLGQVVDFIYREVNQATCDYLGVSREDLLGRGLAEIMPGAKGALLDGYIRCLETGEPVILDDLSYDNEILRDTRRYDLRATRVTPSSITLTWRDVTERSRSAELLDQSRDLQSEADSRYRRLLDNSGIGMAVFTTYGQLET